MNKQQFQKSNTSCINLFFMLFLSRNQVQILSSKPKSYLVLAKSEYANACTAILWWEVPKSKLLVGSFRIDTYDEGGVPRELTIRAQPVPAPTF